MKVFQNGGVAGKGNLTSAFDLMEAYLDLTIGNRHSGMPISYDFISPCDAEVVTVSEGNGKKRLYLLETDDEGNKKNVLRSTIYIYDEVELKQFVKRGESIQTITGYLNPEEIIEYRSYEEATTYLSFVLYNLFVNEIFVSFRHFEILVASMMYKYCIESGGDFEAGKYYNIYQVRGKDTDGAVFREELIGITQAPKYKQDFFASSFFEDMRDCISRNILYGEDEFTSPIPRTLFGKRLNMGTSVEGFIDRR